MEKEPFAELPVSIMGLVEKNERHYKVYKNPKEFVLVEASMAYEALRKSGIEDPYKLEHVLYEVTGIKGPSELVILHIQEGGSSAMPPAPAIAMDSASDTDTVEPQ